MRTIKLLPLFFLISLLSLLIQSCEEESPMKLGENYFIDYDSRGYTIIIDARKTVVYHFMLFNSIKS